MYTDVRAAEDKLHRLHLALRDVARHRRRAESSEGRAWEPGGSAREGK